MSIKADEAEHSIEMHLPYVRKVFTGQDIKIVPIVVGAISKEVEASFGSLLAPYLAPAPSNTPAVKLSRSTAPTDNPIHESIRQLDHEAMDILALPFSAEAVHAAFATYLAKTKNTICGRHPIGVLLGAMASLEKTNSSQPTIKWVRYEQSSACLTIRDSSVSYASAWIRF
ncbi:hypothetical protein C0991_000144 [Blastosporella zonata]|nr:hypothetical protein C0991_000144 [Blastosporella zonata]